MDFDPNIRVFLTVDADAKRRFESEIIQHKVDVAAHDEEIGRFKEEERKIEAEAKEHDKRGVSTHNPCIGTFIHFFCCIN